MKTGGSEAAYQRVLARRSCGVMLFQAGQVPVARNKKLLGIISMRDFIDRVLRAWRLPKQLFVK